MSKELFEIVNYLPIAEDDEWLMFEPENEEDVYFILAEVREFCFKYHEKISELSLVQVEEQSEIVRILSALISAY